MFKTLTRCSTTRSWHGCLWSISLVRIYTFTHIRVVQGTRAQNMLPRQCLDKAWFQISTWSKVAKKGELLDREGTGEDILLTQLHKWSSIWVPIFWEGFDHRFSCWVPFSFFFSTFSKTNNPIFIQREQSYFWTRYQIIKIWFNYVGFQR